MRVVRNVIVGAALALAVSSAYAKVSDQEAAQLGVSLTEFGAEKAGNADGSIPAYTGGLPVDTVPAGWKKGSGYYDVGPYDHEKSLFSITPGNFEKYTDRLSAGAIALLKKYPNFRMDVYPSHRSVSHSAAYLSHCKTNALHGTITESDGNGFGNAYSCVPFPIPKTGAEVMWNELLTDRWGVRTIADLHTWLIDADGHPTDVGDVTIDYTQPYHDPKRSALDNEVYHYGIATWSGPPSQTGTKILQQYPVNYNKFNLLSWIYTPGQRRTRLAPEFSYDTPIAADGGALNYDELFGFTGQLDRYDFKIMGKKEIYALYNADGLVNKPVNKLFVKNIVNPDLSRWELHRVWVVEATLKSGKRHVEPRRTFYIDEDSWEIVAMDAFDQAGNLFRAGFNTVLPIWDSQATAQQIIYYDLSKRTSWIQSFDHVRVSSDVGNMGRYTPAALTGSGVR